MSSRREKLGARLGAAITPFLESGESTVVAMPAIGGPNPWAWAWLFLAGVIPVLIASLFFVPSYVVALTDRRVLVLRGSKWRVGSAKELLLSAPRTDVAVTERNLSRGSAMTLRLGYVYIKLRFPNGVKRINVPSFFSVEATALCDRLAAATAPVPHQAAP
ncbi:MAG: hypothetical protein E6J14_14990 [Chloroflexi bacterium]|nr:MAG: hypothetical protein E6J14_14990 [Chloroflexota bacterium]